MTIYRRLISIIILSLLFPPQISFASVASLQRELGGVTGHLTDTAGIQITSLDRGDSLFGKNSGTPLNPASVTKLVTTAAALKYFGPNYRFHTKFYLTPQNDLYVYGEGDPSLVIEELKLTADELVKKRMGNIRHILIDDSYFSDYTSPGLAGKEYTTPYTGALSLNFNSISIYVTPARRVGEKAKVRADAGNIDIEIENEVTTVRRGGGTRINFEMPSGNKDHFIISGSIPQGGKTKRYNYSVPLPPLFFAETLKALLKEKGVRFTGGVWRAEKPNGSKLILDHESKPLYEILGEMNKFSNNYTAEQLTKALGAKLIGEPGSTEKGIMAFRKYLGMLRISPESFYLVNGSGLTYDNMISAGQIVRIIQDMYRDNKLWPYFWDSLCIAGKTGTLRRRFRSRPLYGELRAKTGTVKGSRAIAGAVPSASGEMIAFAIILNGGENMGRYLELQEKIGTAIAGFRR